MAAWQQVWLNNDSGILRKKEDDELLVFGYSQTPSVNEQPENRTDGGTAGKENEEMQNKVAALEKFLEEKDRHIRKLKFNYAGNERQKKKRDSSKRRRNWRRVPCCAKSET